MNEPKNLHLWKQVEVTNPKWLKNAKVGGRTIKAINPQKQLKQATEMFGPYGSTWGLKDTKRTILDAGENIKLILLEAIFFYPEGQFEISNSQTLCYVTNKGEGYLKVDDEAFKKLETNTRSKALSLLGFSSDVFEGRFEVQGYEKMVDYALDSELSEAEIKGAKKAIKLSLKSVELGKLWNGRKAWHNNQELLELYKDILSTLQALEQ